MNVKIIQAKMEHAEALRIYYTELLLEKLPFIMDNPAPTLEQEQAFIQKNDGVGSLLLLAVSDGNVVGMSGYNIAAHHQLSHVCSLGISIAKPFRRHGIGSRLISDGETWCRSRSVRRLEFEVVDGNPAVVFYQHLGYEIEGRKQQAFRVGEVFRDVIIMAKMLA